MPARNDVKCHDTLVCNCSTQPPSPAITYYLGNILVVQPPRLGEELEPISVRRQVTCSDHDCSIVQVILGNAGLRDIHLELFMLYYVGVRDEKMFHILHNETGGSTATTAEVQRLSNIGNS